MTDRFIERVAELAGQTKRVLLSVAQELESAGLSGQASTLRTIADAQSQLAIDCLSTTQSIEPNLFQFKKRIKKNVKDLQELAADLITDNRPGHSEVSEAANILERVLEDQPQE